jgi:hypothetical protein
VQKRNMKIAAFVASMAGTAALVGASVIGTGAYFSDTKADNHVTGTMGSIKVVGLDGTGANNLDAVFQNMLPGDANSKTLRYSNTGLNNQDVWIKFDADKLHALNQLGTYGEVHISSNGTEIFGSKNLNDGYPCGTPGNAGAPDVCPVPAELKLADNLEPGHTGSFTFSFTPGAKFKNPALMGQQLLDLDYDLIATQHGITPAQS